jgi:hypothetical protein
LEVIYKYIFEFEGSLNLLYGNDLFSAIKGPCWRYIVAWVKEEVELVVHFPLEDVAKINTP